jgi:hypothetical protein
LTSAKKRVAAVECTFDWNSSAAIALQMQKSENSNWKERPSSTYVHMYVLENVLCVHSVHMYIHMYIRTFLVYICT